jgi:hypothetical protein
MPSIATADTDGTLTAPHAAEAQEAALRWAAHLDAGRLTAAASPQTTPEIAENRARTEAILRRQAAARRSG